MLTKSEDVDKEWSDIWGESNLENEIITLNRDPVRPYILKYTSSKGRCIECGSGLGRYVFYLSALGIDIIGIDISSVGVKTCQKWAKENGYNPDRFILSDIREIPYPDNHFSTYISLGVIEHFREGPKEALEEAFRVLQPGGIAIIETPNKYSLEMIYSKMRELIKKLAKPKRLRKKKEFWQYEYSPSDLEQFMKEVGFRIIEKEFLDLKYPLYMSSLSFPGIRGLPNSVLLLRKIQKYIYSALDVFEKTPMRVLGGFSIAVGYKPSKKLTCFFCGRQSVSGELEKSGMVVPTCSQCLRKLPNKIKKAYEQKKIHFNIKCFTNVQTELVEKCYFCGKEYQKDKYFKDYGFSVSVCQECLRKPLNNLELSNYHLKYQWVEPYQTTQ